MIRKKLVKKELKELCTVYPTKRALADELGITQVYLYMLLNKTSPGRFLRMNILKLHKEKIHDRKLLYKKFKV